MSLQRAQAKSIQSSFQAYCSSQRRIEAASARLDRILGIDRVSKNTKEPANKPPKRNMLKGRLKLMASDERKRFLAASVVDALVAANSGTVEWILPEKTSKIARLSRQLYLLASHPDVWSVQCTQVTRNQAGDWIAKPGNVKAAVRQIAVGEGAWNALRGYIHVALLELLSGRSVAFGQCAEVRALGMEKFAGGHVPVTPMTGCR